MLVEIFVGLFLAIFFFVLQHRTSEKMGEMTERIDNLVRKRETAGQRHKASECKRIIEKLQDIMDRESGFKEYLANYQLGDPTNEALKFYAVLAFRPIPYNIEKMKDTIGQLQGMLNDTSLREDFLEYLGAFNVLPKRILDHNQPQQEQERQGLYLFIDKQVEKIQEFINRFSKEM
jgi:hypothetical protein